MFKATEEELQKAIESNANGESAAYNGKNDVSIDFGNANSFGTEPSSSREFGFTIENTGAGDVDVALCPGYFGSASDIKNELGASVDMIIAEGEITSDAKELTVKGLPKSVNEFLAFVKHNPTRVHTLKIQASTADQLEVPIYFKHATPFAGGSEYDQLIPARSTNEDTQNDKRATVDLQSANFQFDSESVIIYKVPENVKVQLTFMIGAIANDSLELQRKARIGRINSAD